MAAFSSLPSWARQVLAGAGLFVLGGLITFGYSWRPLHGALTWEVAALEKRLDERNLENLKLSDEIARLRSQALDGGNRAAPTSPSYGQFSNNQRQAEHDDKKNVNQYERAAAILPGKEWKSPEIPEANSAADGGQQED